MRNPGRLGSNFFARVVFHVTVNVKPVMSSVAFCPAAPRIQRMKTVALVAAVCAFAQAGLVPARSQDVPPPPPEGGNARPEKLAHEGGDKDSRRPGMRPGSSMSGGYERGDRERWDMFKGLPEEERQKVRAAFEKAWSDPDVMAARERLGKANDEYRSAMHTALQQADPEVVKILEKARPPMPPGGFPMMAKMPELSEPDFPHKAVMRLGMELQMWARSEHHDFPTVRMHERIIQVPAVRDAIKRMEEVPVEQRGDAWKQVRDAYQAAARMEFARARDGFRKDGDHGPQNVGPPPSREGGPRPARPEGEVKERPPQ